MGEKPGETEDNPITQATAPIGPAVPHPSGPASDAPIGLGQAAPGPSAQDAVAQQKDDDGSSAVSRLP